MFTINRFVFVWTFIALITLASLSSHKALAEPNGTKKAADTTPPENYVHRYLESIQVDDLAMFSMTHKFRHLRDILTPPPDADEESLRTYKENRQRIETEFFSELSAPTIARIFRALSLPEFPNAFITGSAGVGKSFLIDQIAMLLAYGIAPDYLRKELNLTGEGSIADRVGESFLSRFEVVLLDDNLLSHSLNNGPFASEEVRMKTTLIGLFAAARKEYLRTDKPGKRTLFVINEAGQIPKFIHNALKPILDEGGFLISKDISLRRQDPGYHVVAMTTPDEYYKLVEGDSAIERRYVKVEQHEPSDEEAFQVARKAADGTWKRQYPELEVDNEALRYLVHMKDFLNWPPLAAPAAPKMALNQLIAWKMHHPGEDAGRVTLKDTQRFLMGRAGLTSIWFEGPNGEPPFHDLAAQVKKLVVNHEIIIDRIAASIQAWARTGMSKNVPVFFLGGPTGAGKDTIVAAFNMVLFGHDGKELMFNLGGKQGFGVDAIFDGPPLGNHSDGRPSLAVRALQNTRGTGLLALNEAADTERGELDKLKVLIERGVIQPSGVDSRPRPIRYPVFIMGQWAEEFFESKAYLEDRKSYDRLTQSDIDNFFLHGRNENNTHVGSVSQALLDRAKSTGGVYVIEPSAPERYTDIVRVWIPAFVKGFSETNDYQVTISDALVDAIAEYALATGQKTRGLKATAVDLTRGAISIAIDSGLPERHAAIELDFDPAKKQVVVRYELDKKKTEQRFAISQLSRSQAAGCEGAFASAVVAK